MALIVKFYEERREKTTNMTPSKSQKEKKAKIESRRVNICKQCYCLREKGDANVHVGHYYTA